MTAPSSVMGVASACTQQWSPERARFFTSPLQRAAGLHDRPQVGEGFARHVGMAHQIVRCAERLVGDGDAPSGVGLRHRNVTILHIDPAVGNRPVVAHGVPRNVQCSNEKMATIFALAGRMGDQ
ncbi:hypothetical protein [Azospirillum halopraeferens]|uniref:hypothetical protein n=1 Tax=Azospirillum halopraeferens TaxID=34010 RepID=UPI0012EB89FC